MSCRREKPYSSGRPLSPNSKRLRTISLSNPMHVDAGDLLPGTVLVIGLPRGFSILDVKCRFEIYGSISRMRCENDDVCYITFRSKLSAESAVAASLDPFFGISLYSKKLRVLWAIDSVPKKIHGSNSKLLRGEVPLSRHGRVNNGGKGRSDLAPYRGRELVTYDDIL